MTMDHHILGCQRTYHLCVEYCSSSVNEMTVLPTSLVSCGALALSHLASLFLVGHTLQCQVAVV